MQLWLLVDTPSTDATPDKTTWLLSFRLDGGRPVLHTVERVSIGDINALAVNNGYLWALGRVYDSDIADYTAAVHRWTLPAKTVAPALDASPAINATGTFETSVWDAGLPDDQKALISLTVFTKPGTLDAQHTVGVSFRLDGASGWTSLGAFDGAEAIQTLHFDAVSNPETNAVGRAAQLRFTLATDDTVSPELYAFALHATLRPARVRVWTVEVEVGDGVSTLPLVPDQASRNVAVAALESLEAQAYPIELTEDFDWDGAPTAHRVQVVPGSLQRLAIEHAPDRTTEVWSLALQEVTVA